MHNGFPVKDDMLNDLLYTGRSDKFGIFVENERYLVKLSQKSGKELAPCNEYIASRFIEEMGFNAQKVWLGYYKNELVSIMKDFTDTGSLRTFNAINQSGSEAGSYTEFYTYDDIINVLQQESHMTSEERDAILKQFWIMYICDAILANRDRHGENWGYLMSGRAYMPAPIYDNGSSLFPDIGKVIHRFETDDFSFLCERSETFPASLLQVKRGNGKVTRSNYHQILGELRKLPEMETIFDLFDFESVYTSIELATSSISDMMPELYRRFYVMIVCMRFLHSVERLSFEDAYDTIKRRMNCE